jgi:hypothetical protein
MWLWVTRVLRVMVAVSAVWLLGLIAMSLAHYEINRPRFESAGLIFGFLLVALALVELRRLPSTRAESQTLQTQSASHSQSHSALRFEGDVRMSAPLLAIPAVVAALSFVWALGLGPLSDDYVLASWARTGTLISQDWAYARPFPLLVWAIFLKLGAGWSVLHALNLLCHAATAMLLTMIATYVCQSRSAGLVSGIVFVLFPANFETIAWTAGIFDAIATLSIVVAAMLLIVSAHASLRELAIVATLGVIAVLSKETGVMLPFLLACLLPFAPRRDIRARVFALLSAGVVMIVYVAIRATTVAHAITTPMTESRWQLKNSLVRPFGALAMPFHRDVPEMLGPIAAILLIVFFLIAVVFPRRTAQRGLALMVAGLVWVLLATAPLLNQFYIAGDLQGSRYLYLPLVGFCLALAGAFAASRFQWVTGGVLALVCATWMIAWPTHLATWRDAAALRDVVLNDAQQFVSEHRCSALQVRGEPDNVRGAYVFRTGVTDALQKLPYQVNGVSCVATWASGRWVATQ